MADGKLSYLSFIYCYAKIRGLEYKMAQEDAILWKLYYQLTTYNPAVVEPWICCLCYADVFQDAKKEYLEKKERGELASQKVDFLKQNILEPVKWV